MTKKRVHKATHTESLAFHQAEKKASVEAHHHHHHHDIGQPNEKTCFYLGLSFGLNMLLSVLEIVGGLIAGSAALIADALHNTSDAFSILIALIALKIGRKKADSKYTYGFKRAEIIGGFVNLILLFISGVYLIFEGIEHFFSVTHIEGGLIIAISLIALLIDAATAKFSHTHAHHNVNMRFVFLHNLADAFGSVGVIVSGLCVLWWNIVWIDGLIALIIAVYMIYQSVIGLPEILRILMNAAPDSPRADEVIQALNQLKGVQNAHHLHLWYLNESDIAVDCHLVADNMNVVEEANKLLHQKFGIHHSTIQVESCNQCNPCEL